ncbi:uncharacterized protein LOC141608013 [Silene latifolia]|uniref:uncharacterized protein LOC141608013 n=1 Tax=Silene latifolia TaxID=37657 RepID=UPI003D77FFAD
MASSSQTPTIPSTIPNDSWLRSFMHKYTLNVNGSDFKDWEEQLSLAAAGDGKLRYLVDPSPPLPNTRSSADVCIKFHTAHKVFSRLFTIFSQAPRILQYDAAVRFFEANLKEGQSVSPHILKMIEYAETLDGLGCKIPEELIVDRVLHSLSSVKGFTQFRVNYNMANMKKSLHELHSLLVQEEKDILDICENHLPEW